jgi:hypothetical protein
MQILNAEATCIFFGLSIFLGNQAFGAMIGVITSPEESMASLINGLDHSFRDVNSRHVM